MGTVPWISLVEQLETVTTQLLAALDDQDPRYLEHLERRQKLIERLSKLAAQGPIAPLMDRLLRIEAAGVRLKNAAQRMRDDSLETLQTLNGQRQLARLLGAGHRTGRLNVRG